MIEFEPPKKSNVPAYVAPQGWHEVTVQQFFDLRSLEKAGGSALYQLTKRLEILTGVPADVWAGLPDEVTTGHLGSFSWATFNPPQWDSLPLPKTITVLGEAYKVPSSLRSLAFGVTMSIQDRLDSLIPRDGTEADTDKIIEAFPFMVACLMQQEVTGDKFDEDKAKSIEIELMQSAALEVLPVGFFLSKKSIQTLLNGRQHLATSLSERRR